jgi:hypothetical protein
MRRLRRTIVSHEAHTSSVMVTGDAKCALEMRFLMNPTPSDDQCAFIPHLPLLEK